MTDKMDIDYFIAVRKRCFEALEEIADKQMAIAKNIMEANRVQDWDLYLNKQKVRLTAFANARQTLETIIKNVDSHSNIEASLKKIEDALAVEVIDDGEDSGLRAED